MNATRLLTLFAALALAACGPDMCLHVEEVADLCQTHPFGAEPYCGGVEEPQTVDACMAVLEQNPGLCVSDYVACRDALRLVPCGTCPPGCEGIAGVVACEGEPTSVTTG